MKNPPNPSLFGLERLLVSGEEGPNPDGVPRAAKGWYCTFCGSLRRSSQVTDTRPLLFTLTHWKNSSPLLELVTRTGVLNVFPPSIEVATSTCIWLPVQL